MFNICKKKTIKSLHPDLNNMAVICRGMLRILDAFLLESNLHSGLFYLQENDSVLDRERGVWPKQSMVTMAMGKQRS